MSWEKVLILQLRNRFNDVVLPMKHFELLLDTIQIGMMITSGEGAFRIHPRIPAIQVWSSMQEGYEYMKKMNTIESKLIQDMKSLSKVRAAKDAVYRARQEGRAPRNEDLKLSDIRINRRKKLTPQISVYEVSLREIFSTVSKHGVGLQSQTELIIPLGDNRPVRISKRLPIRLVLKKND